MPRSSPMLTHVAFARQSDSAALLQTLRGIAALSGGVHTIRPEWLRGLENQIHDSNASRAGYSADNEANDQKFDYQLHLLKNNGPASSPEST